MIMSQCIIVMYNVIHYTNSIGGNNQKKITQSKVNPPLSSLTLHPIIANLPSHLG